MRLFMCSAVVVASLNSQLLLAESSKARISIKSRRNPGHEVIIKDQGKASSIALGLGDDWDGILEINDPQEKREFSAALQYETSLTIRDEGPHLDLLDWKHYRSDWMSLPAEGPGRFVIVEFNNGQGAKFPFVTKAEVLAAIKAIGADGAKRWLPIAEKCQGPDIYPCEVGISKVLIKLTTKSQGQDVVVREIVIKPPLGD